MSGPAILLVSVLGPGLFVWWTGRQLLRRDDAALAERMLARRQHVQVITLLACVAVALAAGRHYWLAIAGLLLGTWIGDYPSRRVLLAETWTLATYLGWQARFTLAFFGFWLALLLAPTAIQAAGPWHWPVAGALALALGLWGRQYAPAFLWLMRAHPLALPATWRPVLERSTAPPPRLCSMPVPGGRFVNAFAFPSPREATVLFTAPALELLDPREQAAIFAHEVAHLEHHDRRRCRLGAVAIYALVTLATLGAVPALDRLGGEIVLTAWPLALLIGLAVRTSHHQAHETASDVRALALCGDADALIGGLTKLTMAGRLPRRWSPQLEQHASHPSLARRLHAIRRAAGVGIAAPAREALVVATTRTGTHVILDEHGVSWLDGVPGGADRQPARLREAAASSWTVPYRELVELRVTASWWGGAALHARDRAGTARTIAIAPADVQALQRQLDAVEDRLPHDALLREPPAAAGRLASVALWLASLGALLPLGVIVGAIGIVRPSRAALAAVAGTAGACVLVSLGDLADGQHHWTAAACAAAAAVVAALAAWLAAKPRTFARRKADDLPVLVATGVVIVLSWGPFGFELVRTGASLGTALPTLGGAPVLWAALAALGSALLTAPRRAFRASGLALVVFAIVLNLGVRVADLAVLSAVVTPPAAEPRPLPRVASLPVPVHAGSLRVSPLGTRVAVATRDSPRDAFDRFLILGVAGGRAEVDARDLSFVDEDNAVVIAESAAATVLQHVELSAGPEVVPGWRTVLPGVTGLRLSSVQGSGWSGLGYDADTDDLIAVVGTVGSAGIRRHPLDGYDADGMGGAVVALSPDGRGLRAVSQLTPLARLPWTRLLYPGRLPRESRLWRLEAGAERLIAGLPGQAGCHLVDRACVVCVGSHDGRTLVWRFDLASTPSAPLVIPGVARRSGVSRDGRLVALWTPGEILMIDLDFARATRWAMPAAARFPFELVPVADRLIILGHAGTGATIDVYDARW